MNSNCLDRVNAFFFAGLPVTRGKVRARPVAYAFEVLAALVGLPRLKKCFTAFST